METRRPPFKSPQSLSAAKPIGGKTYCPTDHRPTDENRWAKPTACELQIILKIVFSKSRGQRQLKLRACKSIWGKANLYQTVSY